MQTGMFHDVDQLICMAHISVDVYMCTRHDYKPHAAWTRMMYYDCACHMCTWHDYKPHMHKRYTAQDSTTWIPTRYSIYFDLCVNGFLV